MRNNYFHTSIKSEFAFIAAVCFCEDNSPKVVQECLIAEGLQDIADRIGFPIDADLFDALQNDASEYIDAFRSDEV